MRALRPEFSSRTSREMALEVVTTSIRSRMELRTLFAVFEMAVDGNYFRAPQLV